jgi:glycosyltransferase involved in cell wall biosynthesis
VLGAEPSERYEELFDQGQIEYIFEAGRDFAAEVERQPETARRVALQRVREHVDSTYDVVHFLHTDDMLEECYRDLRGWNSPAVVGSLNGAFFRGRAFGDTPLTLVSDRLFHPVIADLLPIRSNKATLYRCLRDNLFDHLLVPTEGARTTLERYIPRSVGDPLTVVPDPVKPWYDELPDQESARLSLDLPPETPILLCFGGMRAEKGVYLLLDALESYQGPEFKMVVAGSPTDVDGGDLDHVRNLAVDLDARTGFVPEAAVPQYFAAADSAVLPYRRSFGELRPSGVFQKACASHLPIVGPDFGFFQQRIETHGLGWTFAAGDATSLANTLETAVTDVTTDVNHEAFEKYVAGQSFHRMAEETETVYRRVLE